MLPPLLFSLAELAGGGIILLLIDVLAIKDGVDKDDVPAVISFIGEMLGIVAELASAISLAFSGFSAIAYGLTAVLHGFLTIANGVLWAYNAVMGGLKWLKGAVMTGLQPMDIGDWCTQYGQGEAACTAPYHMMLFPPLSTATCVEKALARCVIKWLQARERLAMWHDYFVGRKKGEDDLAVFASND